MLFLDEADSWVSNNNSINQNRFYFHDVDGLTHSIGLSIRDITFPNFLYLDQIEKMGNAKLISYKIGSGQFYNAIIDAQKKRAKYKKDTPQWKKCDNDLKFAVRRYFGTKSEYYNRIPYTYKSKQYYATVRISNHPYDRKPNSINHIIVSIVIPDGKFVSDQHFDLNNFNSKSIEFIASRDFKFDKRNIDSFAKKLGDFLRTAKEESFDSDELLEMLQNYNPSNNYNSEFNLDKYVRNQISEILSIDPDEVTNRQIEIYNITEKFISDIKKNDFDNIPEIHNRKDKIAFNKFYDYLATDAEKSSLHNYMLKIRRQKYKERNGKVSISLVTNTKFDKLITKFRNNPNYKSPTIEEFREYLRQKGLDRSPERISTYTRTWNELHPDKKVIFRKIQKSNKVKDNYKEFERILLSFFGDETNYVQPVSKWLEDMKSYGLDIDKNTLNRYLQKFHHDHPEIKMTQTYKEISEKYKDTILQFIYNYAKNNPDKMPISKTDWFDLLTKNDFPIGMPTLVKYLDKIENEHKELGLIRKRSNNEIITNYLKENPEIIDRKSPEELSKQFLNNGVKMKPEKIKEIIDNLKDNKELKESIYYAVMESVSRFIKKMILL